MEDDISGQLIDEPAIDGAAEARAVDLVARKN
jgi:hypothetical protein